MSQQETVEIKINLTDGFAAARAVLGLTGGKDGELHFLDDLTPGLPEPLPLLHNGIVLRVRTKGDKADATVKLRPCRRSQLDAHWLDVLADERRDSRVEFKLQQDWSGARHSLAASATVDLSADEVTAAIRAGSPGEVFPAVQTAFLGDCGTINVNPAQLVALGPIRITRWKDIPFQGSTLNAERWRLEDRDVLELSVLSDLADAPTAQAEFLQMISAAGLTARTEHENKTEIFLAALAERAAADRTPVLARSSPAPSSV